MAWTDEMVEELKRLWAEGVTTGEIGRRLNISKNSIVGKVHRLGLSGRPSPIKKKDETAPAAKPAAKEKPAAKPAAAKETAKTPAAKPEPKSEPAPAPKAEKAPAVKDKKPAAAPLAAPEDEDIKLAKTLNIPAAGKPQKEFMTLTDLDNHTCRWPLGDPKDDNFHFCGKKVRLGQTYCEEHSAIAYVKPGKK